MKTTVIRRQTNRRESLIRNVGYSKRALLEESLMCIESVFKVVQSCDARWFAGKFYVTDHSSSYHKALAVVRTSSQRSKQHLKVCAAQICLHNCIIFRKTLTNSNKLFHIVTLRHN